MNRTEREQAWDKEFDKEWEELWVPLLLTDDKQNLDWQKVKNEMQDLVFVYKQIAEVYCYITGNQLSKAMYYSDVVITAYEDDLNNIIKEDRERVANVIAGLVKYKYNSWGTCINRTIQLRDDAIDVLIDEIKEE